jgi:hypothetical protein
MTVVGVGRAKAAPQPGLFEQRNVKEIDRKKDECPYDVRRRQEHQRLAKEDFERTDRAREAPGAEADPREPACLSPLSRNAGARTQRG